MKNNTLKPLSIALGAAFVGSIASTSIANASENPFGMTELSGGYMVSMAEGKCGEGKCGGKMKKEGQCGEGKCGGKMKGRHAMMDTDGDGKVSKEEFMTGHNKMFSEKDADGDGFIDTDEMKKGCDHKMKEGSCGGSKMKEGKCGEGKCGGMK
ncbi:MAG: hypothetical protein V3V12_06150 [Gammaproteobacteria bacterium]